MERDSNRGIDIEKICEHLYPKLKATIDGKWINHICEGCKNRTVIMDGAAKVYRTCCAASSKKITNVGSLNKFIACSNTPSKKSKFCKYHMNGQRSDIPERLDCGYMRTSLFPGNLGTGSQAVLMRPPFEGFFCDFCALKFNNKPKILFNLYTF